MLTEMDMDTMQLPKVDMELQELETLMFSPYRPTFKFLEPISRTHFESGKWFICMAMIYRFEKRENHTGVILDDRDRHYCNVRRIEQNDFTVYSNVLTEIVSASIEFKNCYKKK